MEKYFVIGGEESGVLYHLGSVLGPHGSAQVTSPRVPTRSQEVLSHSFLDHDAKTSLQPWAAQDALPLPAVALLLAAGAVVAMVIVVCLSFNAQLAEDITFKYVFQM